MTLALQDFPTDKHGWAELLPPRKVCDALRGSYRVPWVVVGAGLTGLACARRLGDLHPDQEIILLDARQVGQGASGRNSGFAVAISHFPGSFESDQMAMYRRVNRINRAGLDALYEQVTKHGIECQWDTGGFHHVAADHMAVREKGNFARYLERLDVPHRLLDRDALAERLGTSLYKVGIHVPEGALIQPAALVGGLANTLPGNVRLFEKSPVLELEKGSPVVLTLPNGKIRADAVILATNNEASKLGYLQRLLVGSTLAGSFTRILTEDERDSLGVLREWGVLSLHGGGATVRLTSDGRISLRNTAEYHSGRLLSDRELIKRQAIHRTAFEKRFPQLSHVPLEYAWSGVEGVSRNGTNFFGRQHDNVYLAGGYNGSGVTRGTAFGIALADYASGGQSELIDDCLASAPGSWIPPRPFLDVAAALMVRARFSGVGLDR